MYYSTLQTLPSYLQLKHTFKIDCIVKFAVLIQTPSGTKVMLIQIVWINLT